MIYIDPLQAETIVAQYMAGHSLAEVGAMCGLSIQHIREYLLWEHVNIRHRGRPQKGSQHKDLRMPHKGLRDLARAEAMIAAYRQGKTLEQVAEPYGITRERVRQILLKAGCAPDTGGAHVRMLLRTQETRERAARTAERIFRQWGLSVDEYRNFVAKYGASGVAGSPLRQFMDNRKNARHVQKVPWELTFKEWWELWQESGHYEQRGRGNGYWLTRIGNSGPYRIGNVQIITGTQNSADSYLVHSAAERMAKAAITRAERIAA